MKIIQKFVFVTLIIVIIAGISITNNRAMDKDSNLSPKTIEINKLNSSSSFGDSVDINYDILLNTLNSKIDEYNSLGFFKQVYQPSLQATYYALYVLQAIDKLDTVDITSITDYIMDTYNTSSRVFIDEYAYRYLDQNFNYQYYSLTTLLEVNCYAILSLEILGQLNLIDKQVFIGFIWDCYNPITSGFIGQPYSPILHESYRTSTLDNTYFAIKTLGILTEWSLYPTQKSDLIAFINELQSTETWPWRFGGFLNENNNNFNSLDNYFNPSLMSCYYAIKSLEIFNMIETINLDNFHQYLSGLYQNAKKYFLVDYTCVAQTEYGIADNFTNLAASAIGLELSKLTQYTECDQNGVVNFLLNRRNSYGTWDFSTECKNRELVTVYEVIRSLKETGEISKLTASDKNQIANAMQSYHQYKSFSLLSNDIMSLNLIYSIVNAFDLNNRISDLPINFIYNHILDSVRYNDYVNELGFFSCLDLQSDNRFFLSNPLEYSSGFTNHRYILDYNSLRNQKSVFQGVDSLIKLFKLDDLAFEYSLYTIVDNAIGSQFLDPQFEKYGGFYVNYAYHDTGFFTSELRNDLTELEHGYFAIKTLESLSTYLNLGKVKDIGIDINALYTYLSRRTITTPDFVYFSDNDYDTIENKIQKTYFMAYILKSIEIYNLNDQKIKNFIEQNLDYSNIKNIFYSWKLSKLLNLDVSFNLKKSHDLISNIYDQNLNEFYLTTDKEKISQEAFLWIQEMALLDIGKINCTYKDHINPGSKNNITVALINMILSYFGPTITVKYESEKLGTIILKKDVGKNTYSCEVLIPSNLYQSIEGQIVVYDGLTKVCEKQIIFYVSLPSPPSTNLPSSTSGEDTVDAKDSKKNNDKKIDNAIPLAIMLMAFPAAVITLSYKLKRDSLIESNKN